MKRFTLPDEIVPKYITESRTSAIPKLGYGKHLMECINKRTFVESATAVRALSTVATDTMNALNRDGKGEAERFNSLVNFDDKITLISEQLKNEVINSKDEVEKKKLFKQYQDGKFLSNPARDKILRSSLNSAKKAQGNRFIAFIQGIIGGVAESNGGSPIASFKEQVGILHAEIAKFYEPSFPFQASIKGYRDFLLGPDGLLNALTTISDALVDKTDEIDRILNPTTKTQYTRSYTGDKTGNYQTDHRFEAQTAFMEAFSTSLSYFSRKKI